MLSATYYFPTVIREIHHTMKDFDHGGRQDYLRSIMFDETVERVIRNAAAAMYLALFPTEVSVLEL